MTANFDFGLLALPCVSALFYHIRSLRERGCRYLLFALAHCRLPTPSVQQPRPRASCSILHLILFENHIAILSDFLLISLRFFYSQQCKPNTF
ncbi:MAG: hypothetical protein LBE57_03995 [Methanosarcinales archaeon]|nr:hypothetical protein [Methanosarcinales archaeon]